MHRGQLKSPSMNGVQGRGLKVFSLGTMAAIVEFIGFQ
jgi:hypothetical protein